MVHLAAEDKSLYPELLKHKDATVKALAGRYINEIGGLKAAFEAYRGKWPSPASIQANAHSFRSETTTVLQSLKKRIDRENGDLYKLVDSLS
jgi:hypothetical protein